MNKETKIEIIKEIVELEHRVKVLKVLVKPTHSELSRECQKVRLNKLKNERGK